MTSTVEDKSSLRSKFQERRFWSAVKVEKIGLVLFCLSSLKFISLETRYKNIPVFLLFMLPILLLDSEQVNFQVT